MYKELPLLPDLKVVVVDGRPVADGNTFDHREKLSKAGMRWDGEAKVWFIPDDGRRKVTRKLWRLFRSCEEFSAWRCETCGARGRLRFKHAPRQPQGQLRAELGSCGHFQFWTDTEETERIRRKGLVAA